MSKHISKKATASRRSKNVNFLQKISYQGVYDLPTTVELVRYNAQQVVEKILQPGQSMRHEISKDSISWFKITGFSDVQRISEICKEFGIHRFDIKDLFSGLKVSKIVTYDKATFVMMSGCFFGGDDRLEIEQIAFILGENYIISFQEASSPIFEDVVSAIKEGRGQLRERLADYLLYILLNETHSSFINAITKMNEKLDQTEDDLIDQQLTDKSIMYFFRDKRRDSALIRRSIMPMREEFDNLMHNGNGLIDDQNLVYFNDFDDRLRTTLEELEIMNEAINSLMDLYFNNNNLKMNDIMKRLTVISTIFIPLTFMVGVWGMNFDLMPELKWKYGYFYSWGVLVVIAVLAFIFLKKKRWL